MEKINWSEIEWEYVDDGYVQCPDCFDSMTWGDRDEVRNHSPDCEYIQYILRKRCEK